MYVNAQRQLKNNFISDEDIPSNQLQNNAPQNFFQSALSGFYFEGFEGTFQPLGWQVINGIQM